MGRRSFGFLYRSRDFLSKTPREKGRPSPAKFLKEFEVGDKVVIDVEPSVRRGMPHRRYQGKVGVIAGRRGDAYLVDINLGGKKKHLIVLPVHLRKHSG
ncbi:MAG: 50S ribosomal protein L21e [Candidatus Korarchaeum sp.]|nr:50S ribosomal protein L21e [Candidatus Korarchaeum sp.]MDW8034950.1 50S ribosomal protein L21e [Candidatus Korarchaeum sp.]